MKYCCECQVNELHKRKCKMDEDKTIVFCNKEQKLIDLKNKKGITILETET